MSVRVDAIASAFPANLVTNLQLRAEHPKWDWDRLEERTGVFSRYLAGPSETALDFAVAACKSLAADGRLNANAIGAVIFCTQTPDFIMPPNACLLHDRLNLGPDVLAFDITLACSGYIYGLRIARDLIAGGASSVLLATADTYSRLIYPDDRATFCLFGDGGAVSVIVPAADGTGIIDIRCGTSGRHANRFMVSAGGARVPRSAETAVVQRGSGGNLRTAEHIAMDGVGVLSFFNAVVPDEVRRILADNNLTMDNVDWFIFHQASRVALQSIRRALSVPDHKMIEVLAEVGNLVSASIPFTLERALADGRIRPGQLLLLCGFGVGLSWGTALVRT